MNKLPNRRRQKGVFAIEFALGFIVLFMFTMLIFETCRLTYICSVLDYATTEAARDARVQLRKNPKFKKYRDSSDCTDEKFSEEEKKQCQIVKGFKGDEFKVWFYSFIETNGGALWSVLSAQGSMSIDATHYKNKQDLTAAIPKPSSNWKKNAFSLYKVEYDYRPVFFPASVATKKIVRKVLVIDEFERHQSGTK